MKIRSKLFLTLIIYLSSTFFIIFCKDEEKPINIKVVPAKTNKLTIDDLDEIKMEILHDVVFSLLLDELTNS